MRSRVIFSKFWLFGPLAGLIIATLAALIFATWNWIENPSGIFHDSSGTNWKFVYDTAVSWFVPTFIQTAILASIAHFLVQKLTKGVIDQRGQSKNTVLYFYSDPI